MNRAIQRGDLFWVHLDPVVGSEIAKTRPCIIVSSNEINRRRNTIVIVPLTTTPEAARFPLLVPVPSAGPSSKVRTEHVRNVDKSRLRGRIGWVSDADMEAVSRGVARVLGLS